MTIAEWCLLGTVLLYLFTVAPVKVLGYRQYDNSRPRDPDFYKDPMRARALGAHLNGIEAFPFFAVAVILAEFRACPQALIDWLAVLFLGLRVAFVVAYVADRPTLRTILWSVAFLSNLTIFLLPAIGWVFPGASAS